MFAVVETSGKQYEVKEGRYIDIDLRDDEPESSITLEKVVAIIAGEKSQIGQPYIDGATVKAKVMEHGKNKKVTAYKMRKKKGYRLKKGHRQDFTRIMIEEIDFPNKSATLEYTKKLDDEAQEAEKEKEAALEKAKEARKEKKATRKKSLKEKNAKKVAEKATVKTKKQPEEKVAPKPVEEPIEKEAETIVAEAIQDPATTEEVTEQTKEETKE